MSIDSKARGCANSGTIASLSNAAIDAQGQRKFAIYGLSKYNKGQRAALAFIAVFLLSFLTQQIIDSFKRGNALHPRTRYAEANAYRAAMNYHRNGFLSNAGLPLIMGLEWKLHGKTKHYIYHKEKLPATAYINNPPGHYLLLGLLVKIFGPGRMQIYRLLPISLGIAAVFLSAVLLLSCGFDPLGVVIYTFAITIIPAFADYLSVLHYVSYSSSIFLLSPALYLRYLFHQIPDSIKNRRYHQIFFGIGFLQGCLSFEWFFVTVFFPLPLWFFMKHFYKPLDPRTLIKPIFYLFLGFFIAHLLHLLEVAVYYGGLWKTISYMAHMAYERSAGSPINIIPRYLLDNLYSAAVLYYQRLRSNPYFFKFDLLVFSGLILIVVKIAKTVFGQTVTVTVKGFKIELFDPVINRNTLWMFTSAFIISLGWFLVMRNHAIFQTFTVRHFLLFYLVTVLYLTFILVPRKKFLIFLLIITFPATFSYFNFPFYHTLNDYCQSFPYQIVEYSKQQYEDRYLPLYGSAILLDDYKISKKTGETYFIELFFKTHHTIKKKYALEIEVIDPANRNSQAFNPFTKVNYINDPSKWRLGTTKRLVRAFYAKSGKVNLRISWTITDKNGKKEYNPLWYNNKQWRSLILDAGLPEKVENE